MHFFSKPELAALKKEWNFLLSVVKKNKSAIHLDFATGTGRFLRNIIPKTKGEIVALDNGFGTCQELQYFLKKIKRYGRVSIICGDARKMPFRNEVFNSVSSWHGLDEPKMQDAVKEAKRVLKKGGYFIASGIHYQKGSKSFLRAQKHGIGFLTKEMTMQTLKAANFRKTEHKIFYKGRWNEKGNYLPVFNDLYIIYAVRGKK
jgi:ubiquinone/menaquinone biosynthesis C-methylase UbiE